MLAHHGCSNTGMTRCPSYDKYLQLLLFLRTPLRDYSTRRNFTGLAAVSVVVHSSVKRSAPIKDWQEFEEVLRLEFYQHTLNFS